MGQAEVILLSFGCVTHFSSQEFCSALQTIVYSTTISIMVGFIS